MDEEEPLTFDDLQSDSDATVGGHSPVHLTPQELGSPRETAVEVHARESEVEALRGSRVGGLPHPHFCKCVDL